MKSINFILCNKHNAASVQLYSKRKTNLFLYSRFMQICGRCKNSQKLKTYKLIPVLKVGVA